MNDSRIVCLIEFAAHENKQSKDAYDTSAEKGERDKEETKKRASNREREGVKERERERAIDHVLLAEDTDHAAICDTIGVEKPLASVCIVLVRAVPWNFGILVHEEALLLSLHPINIFRFCFQPTPTAALRLA